MIYKAGDFEGTLEELIAGIRAHNINIYKIPLREITEQFIATLEALHRAMPLSDLSTFYLAVSYLIWLKSRMLLPGTVEEGDERDVDMREKLVDALEKLRFSKYMVLLAEYKEQHALELNRKDMLFRLPLSAEDLFENVSIDTLRDTFYALINRARERELERQNALGDEEKKDASEIFDPYENITVNEKYALLLEFFDDREKVLFTELCVNVLSREHITCAFFAVIEAIADKRARVEVLDGENDFYIIRRIENIDLTNASEGDREYDRYIESEREKAFHKEAIGEEDESDETNLDENEDDDEEYEDDIESDDFDEDSDD